MNIVLEGSDATFKTTIANMLGKQLDMKVLKGSSFELSKCTNEELYSFFDELTDLNNSVIDRHIYSNQVYASLYSGYAILTPEQLEKIEQKMMENTVVVYLKGDAEIVSKRLDKRGDEYIEPHEVSDILKEYHKVMEEAMTNGMTVISFDTGKLSSNEIVDQVVNMFEEKESYNCRGTASDQ